MTYVSGILWLLPLLKRLALIVPKKELKYIKIATYFNWIAIQISFVMIGPSNYSTYLKKFDYALNMHSTILNWIVMAITRSVRFTRDLIFSGKDSISWIGLIKLAGFGLVDFASIKNLAIGISLVTLALDLRNLGHNSNCFIKPVFLLGAPCNYYPISNFLAFIHYFLQCCFNYLFQNLWELEMATKYCHFHIFFLF